jgi:hypothetical protein
MKRRIQWICLCMVAAAMLWSGCRKTPARSELFSQIFKLEAGGTLRGVDIGMKLSQAKEKEGVASKHDDQWGYVYEYGLGGKDRYFLEYISKDTAALVVNAIVLNVFLEEKAKASDLFSEIEEHLRTQYGVADGSLGNFKWRHEESNLMVALRMLDDKKSISLSYGALQPL